MVRKIGRDAFTLYKNESKPTPSFAEPIVSLEYRERKPPPPKMQKKGRELQTGSSLPKRGKYVRVYLIISGSAGTEARLMRVHESSEDYLEAILMLKERRGYVRSVDVANELAFTKASVSVAMRADMCRWTRTAA